MSLNNKGNLNCKTPIVVLSLFSLIFDLLNKALLCFVNYDYRLEEFIVQFPSALNLLYSVLSLAPKFLLLVFCFKFFNKPNATIIVAIILETIISLTTYNDSIFSLVIAVTFMITTIGVLRGLSNKFIIIPVVLGLTYNLYCLANLFIYFGMHDEYLLYRLVKRLATIIASISFYIALLLLGLKNRIPAILFASSSKQKRNEECVNSEQALRSLKDRLDLGMISEEEYQSRRAEIISKL